MPAETDAEVAALVARLKTGDHAALAELFDRHRDKLRRMVLLRLDSRLAGRVSASDVLQEAYIDALKRVEHYFDKPDQPFFGWLRLVVGQRLADVHREHLAQKRNATRDVRMYGGGPGADSACLAAMLLGNLTSPSGAATKNEAFARLEEALEQMDPIDREVLALRHFEELSNNETAALLGIEPPAASKRYVRALARLKQILETLPGFGDADVG
ncbi:MAG TPA: sigma-70 family RNA polymerase sigma factor [Gemmata sp.]|jgi:RNA polymerase sigma-70 factor (ECF subfamily)|nr:sigma-70 family RNA polymerase sigma factor [Gemmata sp.]